MLQFRHERKVDKYQWELWIRPIKNIEREVQQCIKCSHWTYKSVKNIDIDLNKRTIFLDVDDVLLDSSVAVIAILN